MGSFHEIEYFMELVYSCAIPPALQFPRTVPLPCLQCHSAISSLVHSLSYVFIENIIIT